MCVCGAHRQDPTCCPSWGSTSLALFLRVAPAHAAMTATADRASTVQLSNPAPACTMACRAAPSMPTLAPMKSVHVKAVQICMHAPYKGCIMTTAKQTTISGAMPLLSAPCHVFRTLNMRSAPALTENDRMLLMASPFTSGTS